MTSFRTEFEFVLPKGYVDPSGEVHREGVMRLATTADEILPLKDPRVQSNPTYLVVILLSRVITRLGSLEMINPKVIEGLFASDLAYLQDFYNRINGNGTRMLKLVCPHCQQGFEVEPELLGGVLGYPLTQLYEEVAYIAYYFHWSQEELMFLEHATRRKWVEEISKINRVSRSQTESNPFLV